MGHDRRTLVRGALIGILVAAFAALVLLLPTPDNGSASDRARYRTALDRHVRELRVLGAGLATARADLAATRHERELMLAQLQSRLVNIYTAGGVSGFDRLLNSSGSVGRAVVEADVVATIAAHDQANLRRFARLGRRSVWLEQQVQQFGHDMRALRRTIERDRTQLALALRAEAQARARARRMARVADRPLTPRAVAAETVSAGVGSEDQQREAEPAGLSETGLASTYADDFAGTPTASGEPYDPGAMTAAHKTLPLGTWVLVQGPGGSALVRINDRGPYVGGRIIDLSRAAAGAVGLGGLATVTITVQS